MSIRGRIGALISEEAGALVTGTSGPFPSEIRTPAPEIPGHSIGHIVFMYRGSSPLIVFGGDVLFAGSIGRTDFPDGSFEQLRDGIHTKLFTLPDDTIVLPGHGPPTTIGRERQSNPFVGAGA